MPVPSKDAICEMGRELIGRELTEHNCDIIVEKFDQDPEKLSGIIISQAKKLYERRHETVME